MKSIHNSLGANRVQRKDHETGFLLIDIPSHINQMPANCQNFWFTAMGDLLLKRLLFVILAHPKGALDKGQENVNKLCSKEATFLGSGACMHASGKILVAILETP
jgi:hypothetical protein